MSDILTLSDTVEHEQFEVIFRCVLLRRPESLVTNNQCYQINEGKDTCTSAEGHMDTLLLGTETLTHWSSQSENGAFAVFTRDITRLLVDLLGESIKLAVILDSQVGLACLMLRLKLWCASAVVLD